jgi:putative transposase
MAWETYKVEQQRLQLVQRYKQGEFSMSDLCRHYGISRKTGHKWYNRFLEIGEEGLIDLSKAPHNPNFYYPENQIDRAIDYKLRHRNYGPKKIHAKLKVLYPDEIWPSPTRLYEIFKENGLVTPRRLRNRVPATAPLIAPNASNDTWAIDLKGWFLTGDGKKCEPLTITDTFSRYLIRCIHLEKHSVDYVWPVLDEAFREFGLPNRLRSDNGTPFGCCGIGRLTRLSINLIKAGVIPEWIDPGHPEQNGVHERFHLTLKQNVALPPKCTLGQQIQAMEYFSREYNFERPHEALGMNTPSDVYQPSLRKWNGILRSPEYDREIFEVRKVEKIGQINWKGTRIFIGETLQGENIGLKVNDEGILECYYGPIYLGKINKDNKIEKPKIPHRRQRS